MDIATRKISVNGLDMNVAVAGEGPDVLLVHGFPDTHRVWRRVTPALVSGGYRVIAPDTRGCGDTDMPADVSAYRLEHLVADLAGLLDALDVRRVRVVAHDWGAVQAWRLALDHPQRVERLAALSVGHPAAYSHAGLAQKLRAYYMVLLQVRGLSEYVATRSGWLAFRLLTQYPEEMPEWRTALARPGRLTAGMNYYRANRSLVLPRRYPAARVPVLGIWSSGDRFLTEEQMTGSRRYVSGPWRYERIEGANHWMQLTAPDRLNKLLLQFLSEPEMAL